MPINERRFIPVEDGLQWLRRKGRLTKGGKYIRRQQHEITDEQIKQAMVMRRQGYAWKAIGELFGVHDYSMANAAKRRGIKVPIKGKLVTRDADRAAPTKKEGRS